MGRRNRERGGKREEEGGRKRRREEKRETLDLVVCVCFVAWADTGSILPHVATGAPLTSILYRLPSYYYPRPPFPPLSVPSFRYTRIAAHPDWCKGEAFYTPGNVYMNPAGNLKNSELDGTRDRGASGWTIALERYHFPSFDPPPPPTHTTHTPHT